MSEPKNVFLGVDSHWIAIDLSEEVRLIWDLFENYMKFLVFKYL